MSSAPPPAASGVRPATPADAAELAALRNEFRASLAEPHESPSAFLPRCTAWMADALEPPRHHPGGGAAAARPRWQCWVAQDPERPGRLRGMVWVQWIEKIPNPVAEAELHGYITSLYVRPGLRGRGLGSALLETALRECTARGVDAIILWPTPESRSLYLRHGFGPPDDLLSLRGRPG